MAMGGLVIELVVMGDFTPLWLFLSVLGVGAAFRREIG